MSGAPAQAKPLAAPAPAPSTTATSSTTGRTAAAGPGSATAPVAAVDKKPARALTVTVGGLPGTGTTTLCKLLQQRLGLPYTYAGALFREEAKARGMSLADFGALSQKDPSIDERLDDRQLHMLRAGGLILEGRLSGWLANRHRLNAVKVWLHCDEQERLRRIVDRDGGTVQEQKDLTWAREQSEADRYRRYYAADLKDLSFYDLVLDSTRQKPDQLADQVEAACRSWAEKGR